MKSLFMVLMVMCFVVGGCATLDKVFVPTYDEVGNEISREPTEIVKTVAGVVPYGDVALNVFLLAFAGIARFKQKKTEKGLKATFVALKEVSKDPELAEAWEDIKEGYLKPAHKENGVYKLVKLLLAKV